MSWEIGGLQQLSVGYKFQTWNRVIKGQQTSSGQKQEHTGIHWDLYGQYKHRTEMSLTQHLVSQQQVSLLKVHTHKASYLSTSNVLAKHNAIVGRCLIIMEQAWASSTPLVSSFVMAHRPCMHTSLLTNKVCQSGQLHRYALKFTLKSWSKFWTLFMVTEVISTFCLLCETEQPAFSCMV